MGTRNLVAVKLNGKVRVAQYGQWDGYPTGQGMTIADFLKKIKTDKQLNLFKERVKETKFLSSKKIESLWKECGADGSGWVDMDVSTLFGQKYPELSRDTGAKVLDIIRAGNLVGLQNSFSFLKDTLWCEYAYILDLNKKTVAVYTGDRKPYKVYKFSQFTRKAMRDLEKELCEEQ